MPKMKCIQCNGTGKDILIINEGKGKQDIKEKKCSLCNGNGFVEIKIAKTKNKKSLFLNKILKEYAEETSTLPIDSMNLSPLEGWLLKRLYDRQSEVKTPLQFAIENKTA